MDYLNQIYKERTGKDLSSHNATTTSESEINFLLNYEVRSSWWACYISWEWAQKLSSSYFAWKVSRKYARYKESQLRKYLIKNHG